MRVFESRMSIFLNKQASAISEVSSTVRRRTQTYMTTLVAYIRTFRRHSQPKYTTSSSSTTMSAAQDKVINVTELLEIIIYFLPQGAILNRAQRVCKKWQAIISKSKDIQEKLFLRPVSRGHTVVWEGHSPYGKLHPQLG